MELVERAWAGIDAGKGHHHIVVIDPDGKRLLSRRVANTEPDLLELIDAVQALATQIAWAIDLADGPAALLIALLLQRVQSLVYLPGIAVNRATGEIEARAKRTRKTPQSSPIRRGCVTTCAFCRSKTTRSLNCGCSPRTALTSPLTEFERSTVSAAG